jgi:putative membrane protein
MKIKAKNLLLAVGATFMFLSCHKNSDNNNAHETVTTQDRSFILQTALANTAEIQAGQLADSTSDSSVVKLFGQQMVTDHTTAQNDLKTLGTNVNVAVADSIDSMHGSLIDTLKTLSGRAFDSVYIMSQIKDHQTVISNFQQEINSGNKTDVISYANKYLPKLQMHLQMADSIATLMNFK